MSNLNPQQFPRMEIVDDFPLERVLAQHNHMTETLASGRESETPEAAVWLKPRHDQPGYYEVADGHHRIAQTLREGGKTIRAELDTQPDDEPLSPPWYDFTKH